MRALTVYGKEIAKYKPLTREHEVYHGERSLAGNEQSREILVNHNLARVKYIASFYQSSRLPVNDLIQEGNLGLMDSMKRFDPEKGTIQGYCSWGIRAKINIALTKEYKKASIIAEGGNAKRLNQAVARINGDIVTLEETIADEDTETTSSIIFRKELREIIEKSLTKREAGIITMRFYENKTLETIGKIYGVTRERIRQIEEKALKKLRRKLQREGLSYNDCIGEL